MGLLPAKNGLVVKTYDLLILLTSHLQSIFLLAIRVVWGWQFYIAGKGKLTNLDGVTSFFTDLHIPFPRANAIAASTTECVGGILLIAGLGSRFAATALTIVMIVALWTADRDNLNDLDKFVKTAPFAFLFTSVVVMVFGPGKISLDYLIQRFVLKRPTK